MGVAPQNTEAMSTTWKSYSLRIIRTTRSPGATPAARKLAQTRPMSSAYSAKVRSTHASPGPRSRNATRIAPSSTVRRNAVASVCPSTAAFTSSIVIVMPERIARGWGRQNRSGRTFDGVSMPLCRIHASGARIVLVHQRFPKEPRVLWEDTTARDDGEITRDQFEGKVAVITGAANPRGIGFAAGTTTRFSSLRTVPTRRSAPRTSCCSISSRWDFRDTACSLQNPTPGTPRSR